MCVQVSETGRSRIGIEYLGGSKSVGSVDSGKGCWCTELVLNLASAGGSVGKLKIPSGSSKIVRRNICRLAWHRVTRLLTRDGAIWRLPNEGQRLSTEDGR